MDAIPPFILVPFALVAAAFLMFLSSFHRWMSAGVSNLAAYGLVSMVCLGFGLCGLTIDNLVVRPAQFQRELVGQQIGSPLRLLSYEASGFQDPSFDWRYSASPELVRKLKRHCRPLPFPSPNQCIIAEQRDGSWWQGIGLEDDIVWLSGHDS